jgi:hypothetical protein
VEAWKLTRHFKTFDAMHRSAEAQKYRGKPYQP